MQIQQTTNGWHYLLFYYYLFFLFFKEKTKTLKFQFHTNWDNLHEMPILFAWKNKKNISFFPVDRDWNFMPRVLHEMSGWHFMQRSCMKWRRLISICLKCQPLINAKRSRCLLNTLPSMLMYVTSAPCANSTDDKFVKKVFLFLRK